MMTLETHATTPRHASSSPVRMLLKYPAKETDAERGRLDALVQCTEREGWRQALERTLGDDEGLMCYITDPARSRFIDLLPLCPRSDVLEIGPGLGQFTTLLAPHRCARAIREPPTWRCACCPLRWCPTSRPGWCSWRAATAPEARPLSPRAPSPSPPAP